MSNLDRSILSITDPTIQPDATGIEDAESPEAQDIQETNSSASPPNTVKQSKTEGSAYPFVQINTNKLSKNDIEFFMLELNDFLPKVTVTVTDMNRKFSSLDYPRDGDVISIYIRPNGANPLRPIRLDFDIESIDFIPGRFNSFTFNGILKVPGIYAETCKAYPKDTSFNHLLSVTEELGLGFASNIEETSDEMVRICPYDTKSKFIRELIKTCYADDDSFFTGYIDQYYYLCLVNVNKQFNETDELDTVMVQSANKLDIHTDNGPNSEEGVNGSLVLSNRRDYKGSDLYISEYGLQNLSGRMWMDNGYKRYCQYYDNETKTYESAFVDPLTTEGSEENKILLKGRRDETFYKTQVKYKYTGKQHGGENGNVHDNYMFSMILNHQNMDEIFKMSLNVTLPEINHNLYRFQRIPVLIYEDDAQVKNLQKIRDENVGDTDQKGDGDAGAVDDNGKEPIDVTDNNVQVKNEFLSGYYVISDITYTYNKGSKLIQSLRLLRREWPIPPENKTN